jgi:hypothetical protein
MNSRKGLLIGFWIVTTLFCVEMFFTAYWELLQPQAAQAFTRLGFPSASFRAELSLAKVLGIAVLLIPALPARLKEWPYAGFAINLLSALIAHTSIHDRHLAFLPSTITSVLWALSYFFFRRSQATAPGTQSASSSLRHSVESPDKKRLEVSVVNRLDACIIGTPFARQFAKGRGSATGGVSE